MFIREGFWMRVLSAKEVKMLADPQNTVLGQLIKPMKRTWPAAEFNEQRVPNPFVEDLVFMHISGTPEEVQREEKQINQQRIENERYRIENSN